MTTWILGVLVIKLGWQVFLPNGLFAGPTNFFPSSFQKKKKRKSIVTAIYRAFPLHEVWPIIQKFLKGMRGASTQWGKCLPCKPGDLSSSPEPRAPPRKEKTDCQRLSSLHLCCSGHTHILPHTSYLHTHACAHTLTQAYERIPWAISRYCAFCISDLSNYRF